jgi:hypothetical protein
LKEIIAGIPDIIKLLVGNGNMPALQLIDMFLFAVN